MRSVWPYIWARFGHSPWTTTKSRARRRLHDIVSTANLVAKGGIEPPTHGFSELALTNIVFKIKLLPYTPSSKSSHAQSKSTCKEPQKVTIWLRWSRG